MRRARILAPLLALLAACDPEALEGAPTLRVYFAGPLRHTEDVEGIAARVGDLLEVEVEVVRDLEPLRGAVTVYLAHETPEVADHGELGFVNRQVARCGRHGWAVADPEVVAHEIGHLLGLPEAKHHGLMDSRYRGQTWLVDGERLAIDEQLEALAGQCE